MRKIQTILISSMALALVVGLGNVKDANAGMRFRATVTTPNVYVHIGNTPSSHYRSYTRRYLPPPACEITYYRTSARDRAIALRLARYTGVTARELIGMKRQGYTWLEIGCWLDLYPATIQAAGNDRTWRRYLRKQRKMAKRHKHGKMHRWNQAAFGNDDFVDEDDIYEDD